MRFSLFFTLVLFCTYVNAASADSIVKECWQNNDHAKMSQCVIDRAKLEKENLIAIETEFEESLAQCNEESGYKKNVKVKFETSVLIYKKYRNAQCRLRETLAAAGNGSMDNKRACEAEQDSNRAEQIKEGLFWLNPNK
jgi:hypothetical protein